MRIFSIVLFAAAAGAQATCTPPECTVRTYYLAINEVEWDYAPSQQDKFSGVSIEQSAEASKFLAKTPGRIGRVYKKAMYIGYEDEGYTRPLAREPWQGILGPVLRANAGDVLQVHLFNNASRPYSFYPHALAYYPPTTDDLLRQGVPAGQKATLSFKVPATLALERPSFWLYHSHVDEVKDVYSGLFGGLIVYPRSMSLQGGGREFVNVMIVMDENLSWYMGENKQRATNVKEDADWVEANQKHSINGLLFANMEGLRVQLGEQVRWYVGSLGGEKDLHTAHWHGASLLHQGHRVDVADLLPGETQVLEMTPDVVGKWLYHCHVNDHVVSGMSAFYEVVDKLDATAAKSAVAGGTQCTPATAVVMVLLFVHAFQ